MKLFTLCLLIAAATPALAENALPAGSYPDPSDGMAAHRVYPDSSALPQQPAAKLDSKAPGEALKGTPQAPSAPTPEPKDKAGPDIV